MKALADPTRLTLLASLWKADAPIRIYVTSPPALVLTQPTISHPWRLKDAGLVEFQKSAKMKYYACATNSLRRRATFLPLN